MTEKDYKRILKDELIKYRTNLFLPNDVTFGIEIEYENIVKDTMAYLLREEKKYNSNLVGWSNKTELDIAEYNELGEEMNGEITSPVLKDNINTWLSIKQIITLLNRNNVLVTEKCGTHINIGTHLLGDNQEYWRNFLLLWTLYSNEIYKFSTGDYIKIRKRKDDMINKTSNEIKQSLSIITNTYSDIYEYLNKVSPFIFGKRYDISVNGIISQTVKNNNRIEFRIPNPTLREEIIQNYINFFAKFVLACKKELDIEKAIYKIQNNEHTAVELADYVFDDDTDKEYFLIQTLKTNKIYKKELLSHKTYTKMN